MNKDILLCGIGGQGTVLASKLIASSAMSLGHTVHSAETIGMAQRGGSVTSHIRIGNNSFSPLIPKGSADVIIAFEPAEAVRNLPFLKEGGMVICSSQAIMPVTEALNKTGYDGKGMIDFLNGVCRCIVIDTAKICKTLGTYKAVNMVLLGAALGAGVLGISRETVEGSLTEIVKPQFIDINKKALAEGIKIGENNEA